MFFLHKFSEFVASVDDSLFWTFVEATSRLRLQSDTEAEAYTKIVNLSRSFFSNDLVKLVLHAFHSCAQRLLSISLSLSPLLFPCFRLQMNTSLGVRMHAPLVATHLRLREEAWTLLAPNASSDSTAIAPSLFGVVSLAPGLALLMTDRNDIDALLELKELPAGKAEAKLSAFPILGMYARRKWEVKRPSRDNPY